MHHPGFFYGEQEGRITHAIMAGFVGRDLLTIMLCNFMYAGSSEAGPSDLMAPPRTPESPVCYGPANGCQCIICINNSPNQGFAPVTGGITNMIDTDMYDTETHTHLHYNVCEDTKKRLFSKKRNRLVGKLDEFPKSRSPPRPPSPASDSV